MIKGLLASTALLLAVPASAADFYFAFASDLSDPQVSNGVNSVVFGRILGLADSGASSATSVIIDGFTSGAFTNVPTDAALWTTQFSNSFVVENGVITSALFHAERNFMGSFDQLYLNVDIGTYQGPTNYASVGVDNTISVWNNLGFDTLVFETAAVVPEPATWAMMLVGFGMLGGALRYRRRSSTITYA
ncbi:MAG: PEP-CTERM sorting domain-containing protein [Oxalobacteraceae bacterium]|nr:MAG: PEP-CTERM sorting domain-containing protein [Oxalobacteraceae bacterium]